MSVTRTRRLAAALAATALVALAACGDDETDSSDGMTPPVPVNVAAAGGDTSAVDATAESASDDPATGRTDMSIAPWGGYEFEIGDGFPALPSNATGYRFLGDDVDEETVRRYADALGVGGDPVRVNDESVGALWRVGPDDGTAPSFVVGTDAARSWYFSGAWADAPVAEPCVATDDATAVDCPEPEPPAGVPTAQEAEAEATRLLDAMGQDPAAFTFETYADEWFASVLATGDLDGLRSPLAWGFGFGAQGALQYANGYLGTPEQVGPYPLVDLDEALERLSEQHTAWRGGVLVDTPAPADADAAVSDDAATSELVDGATTVPVMTEPAPTEPATTEPATTEPATTEPATTDPAPVPTEEPLPVDVPAGEPETSVLVDVVADLWWITDVDGATWLLPAYRFIDTEERTFVVPAVTDEFLVVDPVASGAGGAAEPGVVTGSAPAAEPEPAPAEPLVGIGTIDPATLVGLPVAEATAALEQDGQRLRVVRRDGEDLPVTMDLVETRVNVAVETRDGSEIVTEIVSRG